MKILIIDDEEDIIYTFKSIAELEDWQVDGASEPETGIKKFRNKEYDMILLDYHMPDLNGLEVLRIIRKADPSIPVIVLTIDERYELAEKLLEAGANDYAVKPIKAADLISRIKVHFNSQDKANSSQREDELLEEYYQLLPEDLPKGLSITTCKKVIAALAERQEFMTINDLADTTQFAYQTVHRYLRYMEKHNLIEIKNIYGKQGRPTRKYRLSSSL